MQIFAAGARLALRGRFSLWLGSEKNVLDLFSRPYYVLRMSRASSNALKHRRSTAPSKPAGALSPFPELAVAIDASGGAAAGAVNDSGRFEAEGARCVRRWLQSLDEFAALQDHGSRSDTARKVITRNDSPDIASTVRSTPTAGCEHGCVYCFRAADAMPISALCPGLDFESKLFAKPDAARSFWRRNWRRQDYEPR